MPYVETPSLKIYYQSQGQGDPLVLIRGLGGCMDLWQDQMEDFGARHRVIAFDNRAINRTSDPGGDISIRDMADDTARLLDGLGLERAHVLGLSMGGMVAQEFALSHPGRLAGLVLAATHFGGPRIVPADPEIMRMFQAALDGGTLEDKMASVRVMFSPNTIENRPEVLSAYASASQSYLPPPQVAARQRGAVNNFRAHDRLPRIAAPTLVLAGADDALIPPANSEILAGQIPGARLVVIPQAGHQVFFEQRRAAANAVLEFLAGVKV